MHPLADFLCPKKLYGVEESCVCYFLLKMVSVEERATFQKETNPKVWTSAAPRLGTVLLLFLNQCWESGTLLCVSKWDVAVSLPGSSFLAQCFVLSALGQTWSTHSSRRGSGQATPEHDFMIKCCPEAWKPQCLTLKPAPSFGPSPL